jgi:hypothetical protein
LWTASVGVLAAALLVPTAPSAQAPAATPEVTFTKDIAPILQRSCEGCHRADGGAPMSLVTYEEVRPYARAIKQRTGIGPHAGVMPPWFVEKNIGIQRFRADPSRATPRSPRLRVGGQRRPRGIRRHAPTAAAPEEGWTLGERISSSARPT